MYRAIHMTKAVHTHSEKTCAGPKLSTGPEALLKLDVKIKTELSPSWLTTERKPQHTPPALGKNWETCWSQVVEEMSL